mmetsp:Transcript_14190/g.40217  ORF Transcript_14190/g.40217 Transcript_14190/m.40217 type:complete len:214 (-) Transcript_14190:135-776(-)
MVSACRTHSPGGSSKASAPPLSYLRNISIRRSFRPAAWRGDIPDLSRWSGSAAYANSSESIWYCFWRTAMCNGDSSVSFSGFVTFAPFARRIETIFWSPIWRATINGRLPVESSLSTSSGCSNSVCSSESRSPSSTICTILRSEAAAAKHACSSSPHSKRCAGAAPIASCPPSLSTMYKTASAKGTPRSSFSSGQVESWRLSAPSAEREVSDQ